jgi:hypothetical protein
MMHCVICHNNDRTIEDLTFKFEKLLELHNALSIKVDNMQKLNQTMISGILREMRTDRAGQDEWIRKVEYNVKQIECTIRQHQMIANPTPKPDFVENGPAVLPELSPTPRNETLALCPHGFPVKFNSCVLCNPRPAGAGDIQECDHEWKERWKFSGFIVRYCKKCGFQE